MTPNDIEILIHCHVLREEHPRLHVPAVRESINRFLRNGIIVEYEHCGMDNIYTTTEKGRALVDMLCATPYPEVAYIDPRFKEAR